MNRYLCFLAALFGLSITPFSGAIELRDKLAQMVVAGFHGTFCVENSDVYRLIHDEHVGGLILYNCAGTRNILNPDQLRQLTCQLIETAKNIPIYKEMPLFICIDQEGGMIDFLPAYQGFIKPNLIPQALGNKNDPAFTLQYAGAIAKALKNLQINVNFAPVVDLNQNPVCPIIGGKGRSFSENPKIVIEQANAFINGFVDNKILTALKHFPGHGSSTDDSHMGIVDVTKTWKQNEIEPFRAIVLDQKYDSFVMVAHIINRNLDDSTVFSKKTQQASVIPMTFSQKIVTGLLKETWGFRGVVISDDIDMRAISDNYELEQAITLAVLAGNDMLIISNHGQDRTKLLIDFLQKSVENGTIPLSRIDDAFERIQRLKGKLKL